MTDIKTLLETTFAILILGIILAVSSMIASNMKATTYVSVTTLYPVINETNTTVLTGSLPDLWFYISHTPIISGTDVLKSKNTSSGALYNYVRNTNYTIDYSSGFLNITGGISGGNMIAYLNYTYSVTSSKPTNATGITDKIILAMNVYADWINPIAFITIAGVVIMILIGIYLRLRMATATTE